MRQWCGRVVGFVAFALAVGTFAVAQDVEADGRGTGGSGGSGQTTEPCRVYPIGVHATSLRWSWPGQHFHDITTGTPRGHEGWLRWTQATGEPALRASLTFPGNSDTYVDPDDPSDRVLDEGDWVRGRPGTVSSSGVRQALDTIKGRTIVVPVWDETRGSGNGVAYRVAGFAEIRITSYDLRHDNSIAATYLGQATCAPPLPVPVAVPTTATTAEDEPVTITLEGSGAGPTLTFVAAPAASGAVAAIGSPSCQPMPAARTSGSSASSRHAGGESAGGGPTSFVTCTQQVVYTPSPDFYGPDTFTFTVSDGRSSSVPAAVTLVVTAVNDPPVPGADSATTDTGGAVSVDVADLLANDVPGPMNEADQTLTVAAATGGPDAHGTVTLDDGTITYTPADGFSGLATFAYTACDDGTTDGVLAGLCADGEVTVIVTPAVNEPPVAEPSVVDAVEDTAAPVTLAGTDPDGDEVTATVLSGPSHGSLSDDPGPLTYHPAPDYFGPDEITFAVSDGRATSPPAVVTITVVEVNDPPVPGDDAVNAAAGDVVSIDVAGLLVNDVPGPANEATQALAVAEVEAGPATHGTVVLGAGTITYTPDPGFVGTATFTYTVCDDGTTAGEADPRCSATPTVSVNMAAPNGPPTADPLTVETAEDIAVDVALTASDPDGDALAFSVAGPANGTLSGAAPDLVYTPAANFFGIDMFTYTVTDGQATSLPATVTVTVTDVNDEPVAGTDTLAAPGRHPTAIGASALLGNDVAGPTNEAIQTIVVTAATAGTDTHGAVSLEAGTVTYVPAVGFAGPATFTYTVCDNGTTAARPDARCTDGVVSLAVGAAPNAVPTADGATVLGTEDTASGVVLTGDDGDGDPLTFEVLGHPQHGTLTGTAPDLLYTPAADYFGPDAVTFTTSDGQAASLPATVAITVAEVNDPPSAGADAALATSDQPLTLDAATLLVNDAAGPANESGQALAVTAVTADVGGTTHGAVTLDGDAITYVPDPGFTGTATFTYTLCDDGTTAGGADPRCTSSGVVTVEVAAANRPPVADPLALTTAEDAPIGIVLTGADPDGDTIGAAVTTPPQHGTLTGTAPSLTYTPAADYFGPDTFTFTQSDGRATSAPATVTIDVTEVNDPPVLGQDLFNLGGAGTVPPPPPAPPCGDVCGVIYGDPHLFSFDGARYDVQAVGELIAAKSTTDDFEVQARFAPVLGSRTVSIATAVGMRVAGHRVSLYRTTEPTGIEARVDGVVLTPPATPMPLPGGGTIGTYGLDDTVIVVWPDGSLAIVRAVGVFDEFYRFTVNLGLAPGRLGNVAGLLGDGDGSRVGELKTRDGTPVTFPDPPFGELYGTYTNSWRISQAESLFDYAPGESTATFTDLTYPDAPPTLTAAQRSAATGICDLFGITDAAIREACIIDVGITGDAEFATSAADAQRAGLGIPTNTGSVSVGAATTVVTTAADENAVRTFPTTAPGSLMTITVTDNTFLDEGVDITVRNPAGTTVAAMFVDDPSAFRDVFTLPVAGSYTITINPRGPHTGTVTFRLTDVPVNSGSTSIGAESTVVTTVAGENATRTFEGTAGQQLTVFVTANTFVAEGADVTVRNPSGNSVAGLFVSQPTGFRDVFTLPVTGTYSIVIDPRQQETGTLTFRLADVPSNTGTTTIGAPTTITTSTIGENAVRTFAGTAGQLLTIHITDSTYQGSGADVTVRNPTGSSVAGLFVSQPTGFRDVFTLPVTGTYSIVIDPRQQETGTLTFRLTDVPVNTGATSVDAATTVVTTVAGENATRTFTGAAGQLLTVFVTANTFTAQGADVTVRNPSGSSVAGLFVSQPTGFRDVFTLPVTGTYSVEVDPRQQETGTLTFRLADVPSNTGTTTIGAPTTVTTSTIGENAVRTFAGTAGQRLTLAVSGNTFNVQGADVTVRNPSGSSVAGLFVSQPTGFRDVFTLPVTDTYRVEVDPRGQGIGSLTFVLEEAPPGLAQAPDARRGGDEPVRTVTASGGAPTGAAPADDDDEPGVVALAAPTLTITAGDLLANDVPGPINESSQRLTVTAVTPGPFTHGTVTFVGGTVGYTPDDDYVGPATIGYTACDDGMTAGAADPRCSTGSFVVNVTANHPPTVQPVTVTTSEDTPVAVALTGNDADGEPITFQIATAPRRGTVAGTPPALTYSPAPDANGTDTFTVTATDGHDRSVPATVTIHVSDVNDPPVPRPDTVTARAATPVAIDLATLIANDDAGPFDERTQALGVTAVTAGPDTHGTVELTAGSVSYVPEAGFSGTATIAHTVCDDGTTAGAPDPRCADSTLSIVANASPVGATQTVQTSLRAPVPIVLSATDADGDVLTFAIATPPAHGVLTGAGPNVTYRAAAGFVGEDSFTFTASDQLGASVPATVAITVVDVPAPSVVADTASVRVGSTVLVDVLANDTAATGSLDPSTLAIGTPPSGGTAVVIAGQVRYTAGSVPSTDTFTYSVCDSGGGCASATVTVTVSANTAPTATPDTYDMAAGTTLHPAAPGVLANDNDPDAGDQLQARLDTGVTNGRLLLYSTGAFTYTPNAPGIDTFTYHVVDRAGAASAPVTVTIYITGPAGPPIIGNDLYEVEQGRELAVAAPGVQHNDFSPNPRLGLTVELRRDTAKGTLLLQPDGSFVYTPLPGYTGIDQFSYTLRDSEGRVSNEARVGITVTAGGPPTATVGATSPAAGATILGPTPIRANLVPPPGETVTEWTVAHRSPGTSSLVPLSAGTGPAVTADLDPTQLPNGLRSIVIRAVTSGGGVLVAETGVVVDGDYKPGRYTTTFSDVALSSANIPIELLRTYDSTDKAAGELGVGWRLELADFTVESNGPLGGGGWSRFSCGTFPFLATCYTSAQPHFVTVTWPDGHVERFRFAPNQGSALVPAITTAGFVAEPGTTSTLAAVDARLLLSGSDFLLGDFFTADGIYDPVRFVLTDKSGTEYLIDRRTGLLEITDRNGNTVSLGSDGVESSSGLAMTFVRDAQHRITRVVGPRGDVVYSYSPVGDLTGVAYPDGTTQTFTYDGDHNLLTTSGGGQLVRTVHYDDDGRVRAITANGSTSTITSDVAGHQQVVTDGTGRLTSVLALDERGNVVRRDDAFDGRTVTTSATFDSFGRQLSATDGNGHTSVTTYDDDGNVLTRTDGNGHTTRYTYDDFGLVLTVTDATSRVTTYTYDDAGNLLSEEAPGGATTTYTYDEDGRLESKTDAAGSTTYTHDDAGFPASATDPEGNTFSQVVDPATGWLLSHTDGEGARTSYAYDGVGNITLITDDAGETRHLEYDDFGRVRHYTDPLGRSFTRTYDAAGNIRSVTDRNGAEATYDYDANNRLVAKTVPGTGSATYEYDPLGRLVTASNATATVTFTYDDAGNRLTATSTLPAATFTYTYDAADRRTSATGPGGTTTYGYDDADRVTSVGAPAGGTFTMAYDARGLLETMSRPNGVTDGRQYDDAGALTALTSRLGATVVGEVTYSYDGSGQRTSRTDGAGTTAYAYDDNLQLTSVDHPAATGMPDETFGYDALGNRTAMAGVPAGSLDHDAANRLIHDAATDYTYDFEGNLVAATVRATGATTSYTWSAEHELLGITAPDGTTTTMRYDPLGRRVEIDDDGAVTRYAFDRDAIAAAYTAEGALAAVFTRDGTDPTRALEMTRGADRYFLLGDAIGSTTALTDISGDVVSTYSYDAFGTAVHGGTVTSPFTFAGQLTHERTGLVLFPKRAYDPASGRFLSEDPIFATNPYPYASNDPINLVDPTGESPMTERQAAEYARGGDAAWRDLVRRALVEGEADAVRLVRPTNPRTIYNLASRLRNAQWDLFGPQRWL